MKRLEILVYPAREGCGLQHTGPRGVIFPWKFPAIENLKGGHISERISGNVYQGQRAWGGSNGSCTARVRHVTRELASGDVGDA